MSKAPGRTYRYYTGKPLFPFGYGLSYTKFVHQCSKISDQLVYCDVTNIGRAMGDEVLMVYHSVSEDIRKSVTHPVPIKQLVDFQRMRILPWTSNSTQFTIDNDKLKLTNENGDYVVYKGDHYITISRGHDTDVNITFTVQ